MTVNNYLRPKDIQKKLGICETTFYNFVNRGLLPQGSKLSKKCVVWLESDIDDFVKSKVKEVPIDQELSTSVDEVSNG
jgi:prophage regulatory protein